jgi:hypothetical protein
MVLWYISTMKPRNPTTNSDTEWLVERVQSGVRMEKRLLKVLKALAEVLDLSLGDLLEGIVLHAFEGKPPFSEETQAKITDLKRIYGLDLGAEASHRLRERPRSDNAKRVRGERKS